MDLYRYVKTLEYFFPLRLPWVGQLMAQVRLDPHGAGVLTLREDPVHAIVQTVEYHLQG